jgi:hypothetical protein
VYLRSTEGSPPAVRVPEIPISNLSPPNWLPWPRRFSVFLRQSNTITGHYVTAGQHKPTNFLQAAEQDYTAWHRKQNAESKRWNCQVDLHWLDSDISLFVLNFRFSQRCYWSLASSGVWRRVSTTQTTRFVTVSALWGYWQQPRPRFEHVNVHWCVRTVATVNRDRPCLNWSPQLAPRR